MRASIWTLALKALDGDHWFSPSSVDAKEDRFRQKRFELAPGGLLLPRSGDDRDERFRDAVCIISGLGPVDRIVRVLRLVGLEGDDDCLWLAVAKWFSRCARASSWSKSSSATRKDKMRDLELLAPTPSLDRVVTWRRSNVPGAVRRRAHNLRVLMTRRQPCALLRDGTEYIGRGILGSHIEEMKV